MHAPLSLRSLVLRQASSWICRLTKFVPKTLHPLAIPPMLIRAHSFSLRAENIIYPLAIEPAMPVPINPTSHPLSLRPSVLLRCCTQWKPHSASVGHDDVGQGRSTGGWTVGPVVVRRNVAAHTHTHTHTYTHIHAHTHIISNRVHGRTHMYAGIAPRTPQPASLPT